MSNSILKTLLNLRSKLLSSADKQDNILSLFGNLREATSNEQGTISDGVGNVLKYVVSPNGTDITVTQMAKDNASVTTEIFSGTVANFQTHIDDIIAGNTTNVPESLKSMDVQAFLYNSSLATSTNEAIASIIDGYVTKPKARAQDIVNIIHSSGISVSDQNKFINAVSLASDQDGNLSNFSFLGILQGLLDNAEKQSEQGSLVMDEGEIFYLSHFLGTALLAIFSSLASFIGSVLQWVNLLLGTIVSAVGWIVDTILSSLSGVVNSDIEVIDPVASTFWFNAPIIASRIKCINNVNPSVDVTGYLVDADLRTDSAVYIDEGSIHDLIWFNQDSTGITINSNEFFSVGLSVPKAQAYLREKLGVTYSGTETHLGHVGSWMIFSNLTGMDPITRIPSELMLTDDERAEVLSLDADALAAYFLNCLFLTFGFHILSNCVRSRNEIFKIWCPLVEGSSWLSYLRTMVSTLNGDPIFWLAANYGLFKAYNLEVANTSDPMYPYQDLGGILTQKCIRYKELFDRTGLVNTTLATATATSQDGDVDITMLNGASILYNHFISRNFLYSAVLNPDTLEFVGDLEYSSIATLPYLELDYLSQIPESRMFKFASATYSSIINALVLIGTVTAVALVAGNVASRAIKKHSWKKQELRKKDLQGIAKNYTDNPTPENLNALYKAQKKYNFKAKVFGWDSYDATNNWFNGPESNNTNNSVDLIRLEKMISG